MKRVLLRALSIFFALIFVGFFLLIFPFHLVLLAFKVKWTHNVSHFLNKMWGAFIMYSVGIRVKSINRQVVDPKKTYVFAPNHSSYLDIPICNLSIKNSFRFIGKAELNTVPVFGYMFKRLHIGIDRANRSSSYRSLLRANDKLEEGTSVLIFPEGTIPDKTMVTLLRFKDGGFRLAIENQVPLVPMTVIGADRALLDNGKWLVRPGQVKVIYHDPIETTGMGPDDIKDLKNRVFELTYKTLAEHGQLKDN